MAPSSTAEIIAASTVGTILGLFPGAIAGIFVFDHPGGAVIGAGAGMAAGSFVFLRREHVESHVAVGAVATGLMAALGTAKLIDASFDTGGGLLVVIPVSYAGVAGVASSLWR